MTTAVVEDGRESSGPRTIFKTAGFDEVVHRRLLSGLPIARYRSQDIAAEIAAPYAVVYINAESLVTSEPPPTTR